MFEQPLLLVVFVVPIWMAARTWRRRSPSRTVPMSSVEFLGSRGRTLRERLQPLPDVLRLAALTWLSVALAGPVITRAHERMAGGGLDIMILIDSSRSMLAQDLDPNRFEAAKAFTERLVAARPHDRFGVMTFAARATVQCPLTTDHTALVTRLRQLATRDREEGTALGVAIAETLNVIRSTGRGPAAIVLLTDGASNVGEIAPQAAAVIAAAMETRVYPLGLGGTEPALYPSEFGLLEVSLDLDDAELRRMASATGGVYIPVAEANRSLDRLNTELDLIDPAQAPIVLSPVRIHAASFCLLAALMCLLLELLLRATCLRTFP